MLRAQADLPTVLSEAESEGDVFERVLDFLVDEHGLADTAAFYRPHSDELLLECHRGPATRGVVTPRLSIDHKTLVASAFCDAAPRYAADCSTDLSRYQSMSGPRKGSLYAVPIPWRGHTTGVLAIYRRDERGLTAGQREDVLALGRLVALSLNRMALQRKLEEQARTDRLTGFLNLHGLEAILPTLGSGAYGVLFIDADNFKQINDDRGHLTGDRVLAGIAERIRQAAGPDAALYRHGGEEMVALVPIRKSQLRPIAEAVVAAVNAEPIAGLLVTVTVGATMWSEQEEIDAAIKRADGAMLQGKREGRNRVMLA